MSATTKLGRVAVVGRGVWNSTTEYDTLDIIAYDGSSYLVIAPCMGVVPPNDYYYSLLAERGATGPQGVRGLTGQTGAQGEKGDPGTGLDILGTYETLDALTAAITSPAQGDMYFIGTATPYAVYMYDTTSGSGQWVAVGELQGAKGDAGAVFTPHVSPDGVISWTNNGGLINPESVDIRGPQGEPGAGVPLGGTVGQVLTKNSDTDHDVSWTDDATLVSANLAAASWEGTEAPYTYTLAVDGVTANNTVEIMPDTNVSAADLEALQGANIQDGGQADGTLTLAAYGDKPTVDLNIRLIVRRGL